MPSSDGAAVRFTQEFPLSVVFFIHPEVKKPPATPELT